MPTAKKRIPALSARGFWLCVAGLAAVKLALAGFLIPYIFCYNPALLMINASAGEVALIVVTAATGIASLSFASVGYWVRDLHW